MPTLEALIQQKVSRLDSVPQALYTSIEKEQQKLLNEALKILSQFDTLNGKITFTDRNIILIDELGQRLQGSMFEGNYVKSVRQFASEFDQQAQINKDIFDKSFGTFTDKELYDQVLKNSKIRAINNLNSGAIAERFIAPLQKAMSDNMVSGSTIPEVTSFMYKYMTGFDLDQQKQVDGKLLNWVKQAAQDNYSIADREYTKIIADDLDVNFFQYVGGIMDTTRCFCEQRNGNTYSRDEISSWGLPENAYLWDGEKGCKGGGRMEGTNSESIFIYLGGYRCNHSIIPMPDEAVSDINNINEMSVDEFDKFVIDKIDNNISAFEKEYGLGACGPTADVMADVLQSKGIDARVMNGVYSVGGISDISKGMPHYVTVVIENSSVKRIYDPTNMYIKKGHLINVKQGQLPKEWTAFDRIGDEAFIGSKTYRSVDDELFDKGMVKWWKDRLL